MALGGPDPLSGDHGLRGIYYALVTRNDDPDGPGGRVKVKFPWIPEGDRDQSRWAPLAVPMAGDEFGTYWVPEVGDTVMVVFVAGDIRAPVVLGGCYSKEDKPPEDNSNGKNDFRLLKSRSGHRLIFDDSSQTKVLLSDKSDKNQLACGSYSSGGSGPNACDVSAPGGSSGVAVTAESGTMNVVCPSGAFKVSGMTVEVTADQGVDVKGQQVSLESPAQAKIGSSSGGTFSGSQVKIGP